MNVYYLHTVKNIISFLPQLLQEERAITNFSPMKVCLMFNASIHHHLRHHNNLSNHYYTNLTTIHVLLRRPSITSTYNLSPGIPTSRNVTTPTPSCQSAYDLAVQYNQSFPAHFKAPHTLSNQPSTHSSPPTLSTSTTSKWAAHPLAQPSPPTATMNAPLPQTDDRSHRPHKTIPIIMG